MARLSNKFFNLVVLLFVVPAIIVALDADISANAAPFNGMERRSAFLASEDMAVEARDLSETSQEVFGRELTDREMVLVRRSKKSTAGFLKFLKGIGHVVGIGRSPVAMAAKAAGAVANAASNHKREPREDSHPLATSEQTVPEGSSNHKSPSIKQGTGFTGSAGVHAISIHGQRISDKHDPKHNYFNDARYYDHSKNGIQDASGGGARVPHRHSRHSGQLSSHRGTGGGSMSNHEGESHTSLQAEPVVPPSNAGHRRSFYYDMEDLD